MQIRLILFSVLLFLSCQFGKGQENKSFPNSPEIIPDPEVFAKERPDH